MTPFKETRRLDLALAATSLLLGLFAAGTMVAVGYLNYTRFPWFDAWAYWTEYLNASSPWKVLFDRMNEHRIVVTRLLTLADTTWVHADARLLSVAAQTPFGSAARFIVSDVLFRSARRPNQGVQRVSFTTFAFAAPMVNYLDISDPLPDVPVRRDGGFILLRKGASAMDRSSGGSAGRSLDGQALPGRAACKRFARGPC